MDRERGEKEGGGASWTGHEEGSIVQSLSLSLIT